MIYLLTSIQRTNISSYSILLIQSYIVLQLYVFRSQWETPTRNDCSVQLFKGWLLLSLPLAYLLNLVLTLLHFLIQLSIAIGLGELRLKFWRQETDSNCHPKDLQSCALTSFAILPMERIVRIELTSSAWKAEVIAIIRYPRTKE